MYVVKQGSRTDYNYKEIYLDDVSELNSVLTEEPNTSIGSICFVMNTSDVYCLNSKKE